MQTIQLKARVGTNGILQVPMPPEVTDVDLDVTVIFQPLVTPEPINTATQKETLSQARERLAGVRQRYEGRIFRDSAELLREDRQE